jgi:hypothetical protein
MHAATAENANPDSPLTTPAKKQYGRNDTCHGRTDTADA